MYLSQQASARPPKQLVENRTVYARHGAELSIYDTYEAAYSVELQANELLYCGMLTGKKVLHGGQDLETDFLPNESFLMAAGESVFIDFPDADEQHPTTCLTLAFEPEKIKQACDLLNQKARLPQDMGEWQVENCHNLHLAHSAATQGLLRRIAESFLSREQDSDLVLELGVTELLSRLLRHKHHDLLLAMAVQDPQRCGLTQVLSHIQQNLHQSIEIEDLCKLACMSRSKLYQQFKALLNCSPMEYIQLQRLEKAKVMLLNGHKVTYTCFSLGYSSLSHFTRRFQQQYGLSPRAYCQKYS